MRSDDKSGLSHVLVALGAISFFIIGVPVLDSISTWLVNVFGLKTLKLNKEAEEFAVTEEEPPIQAIGFSIPSEEDEENYDE